MSQPFSVRWTQLVFMMFLLIGGICLIQLPVFAEEMTSSTDMATSSTSSTENVLTGVLPVTLSAPEFLQIEPSSLWGVVGQPVDQTLYVGGGKAPYRWSLISSALPTGVYFDREAGRLLGAPIQTGSFPFTVGVQDAAGSSTSRTITLRVGFEDDFPLLDGGANEPIIINIDTITQDEIDLVVKTYPDDAPLFLVGPNASTNVLKLNIAQMRIKPEGLYRVEGGTPSTVNESHPYSDVYYVDPNGRRHAFPTEQVFKSWYAEEPQIEAVPAWKLSNIPLQKNVTYRPGTIVRLENTREFYRVVPQRTLKKFQDEATVQRLLTFQRFEVVLPLAQVADYQLDANVIKSGDDLRTIAPPVTQPSAEL